MARTRVLFTLAVLLTACGGDPSAGDKGPADDDGDGFSADEDCDDADPSAYPGAPEPCDGVDNDCDGVDDLDDPDVDLATVTQVAVDSDLDGYGDPVLSTSACRGLAPPAGTADNRDDCDDRDDAVAPGADERCDAVDNDCDGLIDAEDDSVIGLPSWGPDLDEDGFGDASVGVRACDRPEAGWIEDASDCDDRDADIFPGADEVCGDAVDADCDGADGPALFPGDTSLSCGRTLDAGDTQSLTAGQLDDDDALEVAWSGPAGVQVQGAPGSGPWWSLPTSSDSRAQVAAARDAAPGLWLSDPGAYAGDGALWFVGGAWTGDRSAASLVEISGGDGAFGRLLVATPDGAVVAADGSGLLWFARPRAASAGVRLRGDAEEPGVTALASGDLTGDGVPELVLGVDGGDGAVLVLTGPLGDGALSGERITGGGGDRLGAALSAEGDIDGDGRLDLIVGAPGTDRVYLISGAEIATGDAPALAWAESEGEAGDRAGAAVAFLGAVAGDDRLGLAVGAPGAADGAGIAFIGLGPFSGVQPLRAITFEIEGDSDAAAGSAVVGLGDVNADENADFVVSGADLTGVFWGQRGL